MKFVCGQIFCQCHAKNMVIKIPRPQGKFKVELCEI